MSINIDFQKVNVSKQTNYVYHTATKDIRIEPDGKNGVTIALVQDLHRDDNRMVDQNLKQSHKPMTAAERRDIEAWRSDPAHPERKRNDYPDNYQQWNLPIDGCWNDDGSNALDSDPVMLQAYKNARCEVSPNVERLREFIATLSKRQRELYWLVYIEERSQAEAAKIMMITEQRASRIDAQIQNNIRKRFNI